MFRRFTQGAAPGLLAGLLLTAPATAQSRSCPDPAALTGALQGPLAHVRYLADDALEGREVGTRGADCAAEYIASVFGKLGLEPAGTGGSWFQTFPVRAGAALGEDNRLEISGRSYALGKDWTPLGFSGSARLTAPLVYGGHGLSTPGNPEDAFARLDVSGRILVVEWGDPQAPGGRGPRADPHFKGTVAAGRSAAALHTDVRAVFADAHNVLALLPGSDPTLRHEYLIVGAHYDHLGMGGDGSLDPDARAVHNGADDNASGTGAILDVARRLVEGPRPARSVLFMAFTGEEKGLWGSAHWVGTPTVPLRQVVAMLNLDMVGRLSDNTLTVFGTGTALEWEPLAAQANARLTDPMKLAFSPDGYGPSDHASFTAVGIPVLHFFTNTHPDYHRPSDDWERINAVGLERISTLVADLSRAVAGTAQTVAATLTPVRQERPAAPAGGDAARGAGPYFGTIPDMTPREEPGLRITGVREGSPAERAGLQSGDVIVEFDGKPVADIYAYTYALRDKKPGDAVRVVVDRGGQRLTLNAVLGER